MISQVESFLYLDKQKYLGKAGGYSGQNVSIYYNKDEDNSLKNHYQNNSLGMYQQFLRMKTVWFYERCLECRVCILNCLCWD